MPYPHGLTQRSFILELPWRPSLVSSNQITELKRYLNTTNNKRRGLMSEKKLYYSDTSCPGFLPPFSPERDGPSLSQVLPSSSSPSPAQIQPWFRHTVRRTLILPLPISLERPKSTPALPRRMRRERPNCALRVEHVQTSRACAEGGECTPARDGAGISCLLRLLAPPLRY